MCYSSVEISCKEWTKLWGSVNDEV
jgi:hypothetical protein